VGAALRAPDRIVPWVDLSGSFVNDDRMREMCEASVRLRAVIVSGSSPRRPAIGARCAQQLERCVLADRHADGARQWRRRSRSARRADPGAAPATRFDEPHDTRPTSAAHRRRHHAGYGAFCATPLVGRDRPCPPDLDRRRRLPTTHRRSWSAFVLRMAASSPAG
jgi:hypothetical protein